MVVPNEQVLSSPVFNHSTGDRTAPATVSVWVPPAAALDEARRVLKPAGATEVSVAEMTVEGVRLELQGLAGSRAHAGRGRGSRAAGARPRGPARARACSRRTATRRRRIPAEPCVRPGTLIRPHDSASAQTPSPLARLGPAEAPRRLRGAFRHGPPRGWRTCGLGVQHRPGHPQHQPPEADPPGVDLAGLRRRRHPSRLHPFGHASAAGQERSDPEGPQGSHGRDRGPQLLRARRDRLRRRSSARRWRTSRPAVRSRAVRRSRSSWFATSTSPTRRRTSSERSRRP